MSTTPSREESYAILGLPPDASLDDVRAAYKKAAQRFHPDKPTGDTDQYLRAQSAYKRLLRAKPAFAQIHKGRQSFRCAVCEDLGYIKERRGAFVDRKNCPECWKEIE